jgi:hypothetical protein
MAAKFISPQDSTGETTLKHWIAQGQIQDLIIVRCQLSLGVLSLSSHDVFSQHGLCVSVCLPPERVDSLGLAGIT